MIEHEHEQIKNESRLYYIDAVSGCGVSYRVRTCDLHTQDVTKNIVGGMILPLLGQDGPNGF